MSEHIIDAFVATFRLDTKGYKDGEREVDEGNKRLRDQSKKTFDGMEQAGRKTGEAIKSVSREVIGLGLAFLGARSITGFLANMATGAASADRFGNAIGMSVKQIWAWRQAVKSVGGQAGDADTALQTIQNARIGFRTGALDPAQQAAFGRLGITGNDLRDKDAGGILSKLAGSKLAGKDPQLYSALLQQIGLPQSTIYFLMQGKDSVDKLLKQYEASAKDAEKTAKEAENLQKEMADLNAQLQKALVPVLNQIVPLLTSIVKVLGGELPSGGQPDVKGLGSGSGSVINMFRHFGLMTGGKGNTRADRNNNPGNIEDGAFARRQPGYAGGDGRFARFASPEHGFSAMQALLGGYLRRGKNTLGDIIGTWAPAKENDTTAYVNHVSRLTGINPNQRIGPEHLAMIARAMAVHEGYSGRRAAVPHVRSMMDMHRSFASHSVPRAGNVTIGAITVHTQAKDAHDIARDMNSAVRRRMAVAQADPIVNP